MDGVSFVDGDITDIRNVHAIVHQVNCLTVKSHGLSAIIGKKYPWADVYSKRTSTKSRNLATAETRGKPGNVKIYDDGNGFHVVFMEAHKELIRSNDFDTYRYVRVRVMLIYSFPTFILFMNRRRCTRLDFD